MIIVGDVWEVSADFLTRNTKQEMSTSETGEEQKVSGTEPEVTESGGEYKTSENAKKGVADILAADSEDESLRKYKESLLGAAAAGMRYDYFTFFLSLSIFCSISHQVILVTPMTQDVSLSQNFV
jgi:hypothetical protein